MSELREPLDVLGSKGAIFYAPYLQGKIFAEQFLPQHWQDAAETKILAQGRSATYKVVSKNSENAWVLRQYYRGGLLGRLVERNYIYTSEKAVRSVAEWRLLSQLHELGLAVPKPIAAIYWRKGLTYQAAILTEYIEDSGTLSESLLSNQGIHWEKIATTIKAIHRAGCVHGDLNAHNILLHGEDGVTVIDFDKSRIVLRDPHKTQQDNLFRLKRSILKVTNWTEQQLDQHWQSFMQAYSSA